MTTTALLTGSHRRTYDAIFQHPVAHNLGWRPVHALLRQLGTVVEEPNGNLKVTRNGQTLVLMPPRTKDVAETDELMALRHFLERSETVPPGAAPNEAQWLVIIDHREARIYRSVAPGAVPQQIRPHVPEESFRQTAHAEEFSRGHEKPDPKSYFEPVAGVLNGAGQILIFGTGTGNSSVMDQFVTWLKSTRPDVAGRIIGFQVVDEHHLSEGQLLAKAREIYAKGRLV